MFEHEDIKPGEVPPAQSRGAGANAAAKLAGGILARAAAAALPRLLALLAWSDQTRVVFIPSSHCAYRTGDGYWVVLGGEQKPARHVVQPVLVEAK
jgi:hypothetical protein